MSVFLTFALFLPVYFRKSSWYFLNCRLPYSRLLASDNSLNDE